MASGTISRKPQCELHIVPDDVRCGLSTMARIEYDNIEPPAEQPETAAPAVGSFFMSVAFWFTLLTAALMYAAVSLSPKLADWMNVRQQHAANAMRLQEMEDEADYLERVASALKNDPEFAQRLVQATQSGNAQHNALPVSDPATFGGTNAAAPALNPLVRPAVAEIVVHLATHRRHRTYLISSAAGLTILAFTLMNDSGAGFIRPAFQAIQRIVMFAVNRYRFEPPRFSSAPVDVEISENH